MEKRYLAVWMWLCEGKLRVRTAHFRLPSASQKRVCLRWPNTVFVRALADAIQRAHKDCKNKHAVDTVIVLILLNARSIFAIFRRNWTQCVDGFSLL